MNDADQAASQLETAPCRLRGISSFATESELRIITGGLIAVGFLMTAVMGGAHFALMSLT